MRVNSYGTPKVLNVYEGEFKGVKYTIKEIDVDDEANDTEEEKSEEKD